MHIGVDDHSLPPSMLAVMIRPTDRYDYVSEFVYEVAPAYPTTNRKSTLARRYFPGAPNGDVTASAPATTCGRGHMQPAHVATSAAAILARVRVRAVTPG